MAENSLFPASVHLFYRTENAPHMATIPVNEWSFPSGGHDQGTFLTWEDTEIDVDDMVNGLVDLYLPFFYTTTNFTHYIVNTYEDADAPARPQINKKLTGKVGTGGTTIPAAQATFNFKTTGFGVFRLVMLDARVSATFQPVEDLVSPTYDDEAAIVDYVVDPANAFRGRDELKPSILVRITYTLNEKLRDSYHLS
jgi:hypothetical protein